MKDKDSQALVIGAICSVLLLGVFAYGAKAEWKLLDLEAHWIALGVLPLVLGLFLGGYITKFKGLGVEIEAAVERKLVEREIEENEEAQDETDGPIAAKLTTGAKNVVLWATGGKRRPTGEIEALEHAGFKVVEVDPSRAAKNSELNNPALCAVVTNLLHGRNYSGGLDLATQLRTKRADVPIVLFTSETARKRRESHNGTIAANRIVTDTGQLLNAALALSQ